jgi:hypothetical protein
MGREQQFTVWALLSGAERAFAGFSVVSAPGLRSCSMKHQYSTHTVAALIVSVLRAINGPHRDSFCVFACYSEVSLRLCALCAIFFWNGLLTFHSTFFPPASCLQVRELSPTIDDFSVLQALDKTTLALVSLPRSLFGPELVESAPD